MDLSEQVTQVRSSLVQALRDCIQVNRTISERLLVLNLGGSVDAVWAGRLLSNVCNEVVATLDQLDKTASAEKRAAR
jgi:hypothetical protein